MRRPPPRFFPRVPAAAMVKHNGRESITVSHRETPILKNPNIFDRDPLESELHLPPPGPAGDVSPSQSPPWSKEIWCTDGFTTLHQFPCSRRSSDFIEDSQKYVDQWGETFVPETYQDLGDVADSAGDASAVDSEAALWAGYIIADTYEDTYDGFCDAAPTLSGPNPKQLAPTLSGPNPKQLAVATAEEIKQSEWEEKMWKMLKRMEAKDSVISDP